MAEQTIDKLQIEVQATAKGTNLVFGRLEQQLLSLQKVLNAIDVSKLSQVQKAVNNTNIGIKTDKMSKAEKDIAKSVSSIQQSVAGLKSYYNAALNGDSSAATSFERRVTSIQSAMDVLQEKFRQLGNVKIYTPEMDDIQRKMENTKSALDAFEKKAQEMRDTGKNVTDKETYAEILHSIRELNFEFDKLKEKQNALEDTGKAYSYPLDQYKESAENAQSALSQMVDTLREVLGQSANLPPIEPKVDNSELERTAKEAAKARQELREMFGRAVSKALSGLKSALGKIGSALTGIGAKAREAGDKGFMKLLKYGFGIRSIYVLFRRLRKAVTESFGELQKSGAFYETTKANVDALKTSLLTLKFQFGAAFEPIFNAVAPALQAFINYLITAANVISAFMAKLTGKSTYSKVQSVTLAAKNNLGGAAKNAKELNKQLQKFDELNNLTTNNGGGGGGGGGGADSDSARYTEEAVDNVLGDFGQRLAEQIRAGDWEGVGQTISDKLSEAMESIKWDDVYAKARGFGKGLADFLNGLINPRLFGNLGTTLANSINTAFEFLNSFGTTFDWTNFGTSIGTGITNFFQNADFALWGSTVHTWIAGLLNAGISLVDNTDWALIGTKLGDFLENLNIPDLVTKLGKLAVKIAEGLGEALLNLAGSGTAGAIAASIATVLGGLVFWGKLGNLASNIGAALGITNWTGKIPKSCGANMLSEIGTQLEGGSLSLGTLTLLVGEFVLVGNIASAVLEKLYLLFGDEEGAEYQREYGTPSGQAKALGETWDFLVDKSKDFFSENGYSAFDTSGSSILDRTGKRLGDLWDWISGLWSDTGSIDTEGMEAAIGKKTGLSGKFGLASVLGNAILGKTGNAKNNPLSKALDTITKKFQTANKTQTTFYNNTQSGSKKSGETLEKSYGDASEGIVHAITGARVDSDNAWANIGNQARLYAGQFQQAFSNVPSDVSKKFGSAYTQSTDKWSSTGTWVSGVASTVKGAFNDVPENVSGKFGTAYNESTNKWKNASNWAVGKSNDVKNAFNDVPSDLTKKFGTAYNDSTNKWANVGTWATGKSNAVKNAFSDMPSNVATKFGDAYTQGTNKWSNTGNWVTGVANTVKNGFNDTPSNVSGKFGTAYSESTKKWADTGTWAKSIVDTIQNKLAPIPENFKTTFENARLQATARLVDFRTWFNAQNFTKKASLVMDIPSAASVQNRWNEIANIWKDPKAISLKIEASGSNSFNINDVVSSINGVIYELNSNLDTAVSSWKQAGMKIKSYSKMAYIQRRAARGGIVDMATPLLAGEDGTEAIVPLQNHTEWLGKMADMMVGEMVKPQHLNIATSIASPYNGSADSSAVAEQNSLLREQNSLLREIASKELSIGDREVFNAVRRENSNYINRTGASAFA